MSEKELNVQDKQKTVLLNQTHFFLHERALALLLKSAIVEKWSSNRIKYKKWFGAWAKNKNYSTSQKELFSLRKSYELNVNVNILIRPNDKPKGTQYIWLRLTCWTVLTWFRHYVPLPHRSIQTIPTNCSCAATKIWSIFGRATDRNCDIIVIFRCESRLALDAPETDAAPCTVYTAIVTVSRACIWCCYIDVDSHIFAIVS